MTEPAATSIEEKPLTEEETITYYTPALENLAVLRCWVASKVAQGTAAERDISVTQIMKVIRNGYCAALPPLVGYENVCDNIACVSFGMSLGFIEPETGSKLLYAAQIALSAIPPADRTAKREVPPPPSPPPSPLPLSRPEEYFAPSTLTSDARTQKKRPFQSIPVEDIPYYGKK